MLDNNAEDLKSRFLGWQCRLRQHAVRHEDGRPSEGMRPEVLINGRSAGSLVVMITKLEPATVTQEFRHLILKTQDPEARYKSAIKLLSEYYYQRPAEFSDELVAVFALEDDTADKLLQTGEATLSFYQANHGYKINCHISEAVASSERYQATYWHNHLFNPRMPGRVRMICFNPDWTASKESRS